MCLLIASPFWPFLFRPSARFPLFHSICSPLVSPAAAFACVVFCNGKHMFLHFLQHVPVPRRLLLPQSVLHVCAAYSSSSSLRFQHNRPPLPGLVVRKEHLRMLRHVSVSSQRPRGQTTCTTPVQNIQQFNVCTCDANGGSKYGDVRSRGLAARLASQNPCSSRRNRGLDSVSSATHDTSINTMLMCP